MRDGRAVTVVVVTFNSAGVLGPFLDALPSAMASVERWELILVDNASSDSTLGIARSHPTAARIVALDENRGYAAGLNAGVRTAPDADAYLFVNPDVRLGPRAAVRLLTALDEPQVGIAVPRLHDAEGRLSWSLHREPTIRRALGEALVGGGRAGRSARWGEVITTPESYEATQIVDWASGAVMMVAADCLRQVGPWDESFFLYSEETEFCLRARDAGWRVMYRSDAPSVHLGGESGDSAFLRSILTVNRVELYRRRHGRVRTTAFHCAVITNEALRAMGSRAASRAALLALIRPSRRYQVS